MTSVFQTFGLSHVSVLILISAIAAALIFNIRRLRQLANDLPFRYVFAIALLANELAWWFFIVSKGYRDLPLDLCSLALICMVWAFFKENQRVGELAFFWGLAGSSQAVLTPDLSEGFPSYSWLKFFLSHGGVVLGAVYITVRRRYVFTIHSVWRAWLTGLAYIAVVGTINWLFGFNFGYLAAKPTQPSALDYFGPWPFYIIVMTLVALVLFFLCFAFSRWLDHLTES